ncbi:MAG TPA: MMPL family transporter [Thermomicrobiales bacterium]|nr:MMPL family transporter [Thermomicrobiales bacterium]
MTTFYSWIARTTYRYKWWLLGLWVVVFAVAAVGARASEHAMKVGGFSLPGTEFHSASEVLSDDLDLSSDKAALVVFHSDELLVTEAPFHAAVESAVQALAAQEIVTEVESFYETGIPDMVSPDNHTTYAWVTLEGDENLLEEETPHLRELVSSDTIDTYLIGNAAVNYDIEKASAEDLVRVEKFTFPIVFILLVLVFGSLVAAGVPLVLGLATVLMSLSVLWIVAQVTDISIFALNTASMIGLGLAIDFSLIIVSRFREELANRSVEDALDVTLQTAGRSITFSGVTLALTMSVLTLFPIMVIRSIALAIVVVAVTAILTGLFLLPVMLALLGHRINSVRVGLPFMKRSSEGKWYRWAMRVMRRPWVSLAAGLLILGLLALPALWLERSGVTVDTLPESSESRQAFELVQRQFGDGEPTPVFIVVQTAGEGDIWQPAILEGVYDLHQQLASDPRVARVQSLASLIPNPSRQWILSQSPASIGANSDRLRIAKRLVNIENDDTPDVLADGPSTTTVVIAYPVHEDTDEETIALMQDLRSNAEVWAPGLSAGRVLVGGSVAQHYDFDRVVYDQFPLLLAFSLLVTFVILMIFFHSIILPIKAILLNLVSIVAAYGVLVLVFQFGIGDSLIGLDSIGAILSYTPVLLFSIVFGLSTDYEVFLLTRVREYYLQGKSNEESVALGLDRTAGIITAAGLIMIAVFGSFALTGVLVIKEIGFGLAIAVLIDTTLVRLVLVPASMKLMGDRNWWMPKSLSRFIPQIDEGESVVIPAPVPGAAGGR